MILTLTLYLLVLALGAVALAGLWRAGCLNRSALAAGPARPTGLHPLDVLVVFVLMVLGAELGQGVIGYLLAGRAVTDPAVSTLEQAGVVLVGQLVGKGPAVVYVLVRVLIEAGGGKGLRALGLNTRQGRWQLRVTGLALLAGLPILYALGVLVNLIGAALGFEPPTVAHEMLVMLQEADSLEGVLAIVVSAVLVAAVLEEVLFRGLLQSVLLAWWGPAWRWTIVVVAAALFAVIHLGAASWNALPTLFVLGLILGWLYERTGSLWPPILLHAAFNAFNIALVMVVYE